MGKQGLGLEARGLIVQGIELERQYFIAVAL
jgi:hypothetical protein